MRGVRFILLAVILGFAGIAGAVGPMTLARTGDLYSVATVDNQVVVTARYADGTVDQLYVPQSAAAVEDSLQVGVDHATGALYVLWQKKTEMEARLRLAGYLDGTWIGPVTFAGNDGTAASNPQMIIHRVVSTYDEATEEGEEPVEVKIATTFIHLAWWSRASEDEVGAAQYMAVPIDDDGVPLFRDVEPISLIDFLPYGIACFDIGPAENLKHPKLLRDPRKPDPDRVRHRPQQLPVPDIRAPARGGRGQRHQETAPDHHPAQPVDRRPAPRSAACGHQDRGRAAVSSSSCTGTATKISSITSNWTATGCRRPRACRSTRSSPTSRRSS